MQKLTLLEGHSIRLFARTIVIERERKCVTIINSTLLITAGPGQYQDTCKLCRVHLLQAW
jgi:hypothetical protein